MADEPTELETAPPTDETLTQRVARVSKDWDPIMGERPKLVQPKSLSERYDVLFAQEEGELPGQRLLALALALAWPKLRRQLQSASIVYKGDPARFGGKAFEFLVERRDVKLSELLVWGKAAVTIITGDELPGLELATTTEDAVGNSPDTEG